MQGINTARVPWLQQHFTFGCMRKIYHDALTVLLPWALTCPFKQLVSRVTIGSLYFRTLSDHSMTCSATMTPATKTVPTSCQTWHSRKGSSLFIHSMNIYEVLTYVRDLRLSPGKQALLTDNVVLTLNHFNVLWIPYCLDLGPRSMFLNYSGFQYPYF